MNKILEIISDWWYDFIINPIHNVKHHTKWFIQRRIRGFDDREIWNIDNTFYNWLLPRLKRFTEKSVCYPCSYKSMSSWQKELINRTKQLELIVKYDYCEHEFPCPENYLTPEQIKKLIDKEMEDGQIRYIAFERCVQNFNKWFSKNVSDLWY